MLRPPPVIEVFSDSQRAKDELPIGIAGVVLLALAYLGYSRDQDATRESVEEGEAHSSPTR